MNGLNTKHEEFTPAKGDPATIKLLISEFQLEEIVSFDETDQIITTTIQHNRHIRLSDLLTLNVTKVVVFTLPQYLQVIRQLFELLQGMKQLQIQHGDLRMENILLDLTSSSDKLDNKPIEVMFQIKLINFAQFNNFKMEDDFERGYQIYRQITEFFPQYLDQLEIKNLIDIQKEELFLQSLDQLKNKFKSKQQQNFEDYIWNSTFLTTFLDKYYKQLPLPNHSKQIYYWIQQNHQYYLIVNHYPRLISQSIFTSFNYSNEPKNFSPAYKTLEFNQETIPEEILNIQVEEEKKAITTAKATYKQYIASELWLFLKQKGYFQNIEIFGSIIHYREEIIQFKTNFFQKIIQDLKNETIINQLFDEMLKPYCQSQQILKNIVFAEINQFKTTNQSQEYNECVLYPIKIKQKLIEQLDKFKLMGYKYSQLLADHCINKMLGMQLKQKDLPDAQSFNNLMVDSWLKWIDQYIFNQSQLSFINKQQFKQFIQEKGFELIQNEMKRYIDEVSEAIFKKMPN